MARPIAVWSCADAAAAPSAAGVFVRLAHVRPNNSRGTVTVHWPLPEPAWLDGNTSVLVRALPTRTTHERASTPPDLTAGARLRFVPAGPTSDRSRDEATRC